MKRTILLTALLITVFLVPLARCAQQSRPQLIGAKVGARKMFFGWV